VRKAFECLVLPEGTTLREGASWYVNPMTALGFVETMRQEGYTVSTDGPQPGFSDTQRDPGAGLVLRNFLSWAALRQI
jgi:hypothetical protein